MTENGWPPDTNANPGVSMPFSQMDSSTIPGTGVSLPLQIGYPNTIMKAFAADINRYVEPLDGRSDIGGWTNGNSVKTSNHLGGTAMDLAWDNHPFQVSGTYNTAQQATIRELLNFYEGIIYWGGDWSSPVDEMHYQMGYNTYGQNQTLDSFIARKITGQYPNFFSTFQPGATPVTTGPDPAQMLYDAMLGDSSPLTLAQYGALLPAVAQSLNDCQCNTVNRIAMWMAQVGEESGGLQWMEELASGSEYEGRADLGNTVPGDGPRFKGRGPIQVTGRNNYTTLSAWAFNQNLVPTPTFFVDDPAQLASTQYGFMGVTWYWTTQRPMNDAADAGDIVLGTRYVNGGTNGLADRTNRWNNALKMGDTLFAITQGDEMAGVNVDGLNKVIDKLLATSPDRCIYRDTDNPTDDTVGKVWSTFGMTLETVIEHEAMLGDASSIAKVQRLANGQGPGAKDQWAIDRAKRVLAAIPKPTA